MTDNGDARAMRKEYLNICLGVVEFVCLCEASFYNIYDISIINVCDKL